MKTHTVNLTMAALRAAGVHTNKATVAVMGVSYKKDMSDTRESPAVEIIEELSKKVDELVLKLAERPARPVEPAGPAPPPVAAAPTDGARHPRPSGRNRRKQPAAARAHRSLTTTRSKAGR